MLRSPSKGKERAHEDDLSSPQPPFAVYQSTPHSPPSRPLSLSGSYSVMSSPVSSSPSRRSSTRGSMLVQASDILGNLKFGRRRKSVRQPLPPARMPIILPEVIEIGPIADAEVEERDRLREEREEAAQALGLAGTPVVDALHSLPNDAVSSIDHASISQDNHEDHDHSEFQEDGELSLDKETVNESISRTSDSTSSPNNQRIPHPYTSSISVSIPPTPTSPMASVIIHGRHRSGSMPAAPHSHNRSSSIISTPVPPFPSTPSALAQFIQISSTLPKFYPSSSLRIFALTRQWKNRFMVLSTPVALPTLSSRNRNPSVSYLHLFKSSSAEDKELERLEINEDSVVFVADEEVGGRRHVIKVGGRDVGALKKELNTEDGGRTMWFLQITDSVESHKWITSIKNAIFGQRTMRAGLGHSNPGSGVIEPRGDMDVMLSMRTQGLINSPTQSKSDGMDTKSQRSPTFSVSQDTSHSYAASVASVRTQSTVPKSNNTGGAVLTLKGLFTGANGITVGRPRSSSRATSLVEGESQSHGEDAVGGNNLMSILSTSGTESMGSGSLSDGSQTQSGAGGSIAQPTSHPHAHVARALSLSSASSPLNNRHANQHTHGSIMSTLSGSPLTNESCPVGSHSGSRLDRKILANPIAIESGSKLNSKSSAFEGLGLGNGGLSPRRRDADSHARPMSAGSISLHPPPRKRWTSSGMTPLVYTDSPTTISSQLPPDTHSEMGVMGMGFHVQNASTSSIVNGNGNGTVESGKEVDTEGQDLFNPSFSFGTPPQRPRSASSRSARSVSTLGSVHSTSNSPIPGGGSSSPGVDRSSIGTKRSSGARRWSRQLPQRLTPPSIPPPAIPASHTQNGSVNGNGSSPNALRHPYSAEKRSSSQSQSSGTSELNLPSKFYKRASASSAFSVKSTSTNQSFGSTSHVRAGSNRASVPPPPRPAPTFALPSAPVSESGSSVPNSASATPTPPPSITPSNSKRSSFRESMTKTNRALRLSLSAPKPPPSSVLPPRPDEASRHGHSKSHSLGQNPSQGHRRSHSGSSSTRNSSLYSIPGSPGAPSPLLASPFPPPRGPLPPTPPTVTPYNNETPPVIPHPSSRASSMKRRLRILSAPPPTNSSTPASAFINGLSGSTRSSTLSPINPTFNIHNTSLPSTPVLNQYDSSFLSLATPATPSLPTPKIHTLTEPEPEPVISLSPPPRRGSKRISIVDSVGGGSIHEEPGSVPPLPRPLPDPLPDPLPSAASAVVPIADSPDHSKPQSRHGSVISLGIVSV